MLHAGQGTAVLTGSIPSFAKELVPQELCVYVNGRYRATHRVAGDFRISIPHNDAAMPLSVRIEASRCIRSSYDSRKLAYLFGAFSWEGTKCESAAPILARTELLPLR